MLSFLWASVCQMIRKTRGNKSKTSEKEFTKPDARLMNSPTIPNDQNRAQNVWNTIPETSNHENAFNFLTKSSTVRQRQVPSPNSNIKQTNHQLLLWGGGGSTPPLSNVGQESGKWGEDRRESIKLKLTTKKMEFCGRFGYKIPVRFATTRFFFPKFVFLFILTMTHFWIYDISQT